MMQVGCQIKRSLKGRNMFIQKQSMLSGKINEMELPITNEQIEDWQSGRLIQHAMPHLDEWQREFLITGVTKEEWVQEYGG